MTEFEIANEADQQFATILENRRVSFRLRYSETSDRWSLDLSVDDLPVLMGVRIVTGVDLLSPYNLGLGILFALPSAEDDAPPNRTNLPSGVVRLYHTTDEEVEATLAA